MLHCAPLEINGYSGGFNAEELAEASYARSARSRTTFVYKSPHATAFNAAEYLNERLNDYVIGVPNRFSNVNSLFLLLSYCGTKVSSAKTLPLWLTMVNDEFSAVDMDGLAVTIQAISKVIHEEGPSGVDLTRVRRSTPSPQHLVAILRTTYPFRKEIRGWGELCNFAKEYLPTKGYRPESVMRGLLV